MFKLWTLLVFGLALTGCGIGPNRTNPLDRAILETREPFSIGPSKLSNQEIAAIARQNLLNEMQKVPKNKLAISEYMALKDIHCDRSIWAVGKRTCIHETADEAAKFSAPVRLTEFKFTLTVDDWLKPEETLQVGLDVRHLR